VLLFVRWNDNNIVTMATNYDSVDPVGKVKRWFTVEKAKVDIPQPLLFQTYNSSMGGVDLLDPQLQNKHSREEVVVASIYPYDKCHHGQFLAVVPAGKPREQSGFTRFPKTCVFTVL
jgi:hypothetical protein